MICPAIGRQDWQQGHELKISENRPEARQRALGAFFDIFAGDFCYRTARCCSMIQRVRMRILAFGIVPRGGLWQYRGIVRLLLTQVVVGIWIVLLC